MQESLRAAIKKINAENYISFAQATKKKVEDYYKSCNNWQQTLDYIDTNRLDSGSGNGGECDIEVLTWKEISHYIRKCNRSKYDKKNGVYLKIEIDHSRKRSIDWIRNNLDVVYFEDHS